MVRLSGLALCWSVLLLACAHAAAAGSLENPEITDEQNDQKVTANGMPVAPTCAAAPPTGCVYIPADVWFGWVEESGPNLMLSFQIAQAPPSTFGTITYTFSVTAGGTTYLAKAIANQAFPAGDGMVNPGGVATEVTVADTTITLTVPKTAVPLATPGSNLTQLFVTSSATGGPSGQESVSDRAPSTGFGHEYTMLAPTPPATNSTASDSSSTSSSKSPSSSSGTGHTDVVCTPGGQVTNSCPPGSSSAKASPLGIHDALAAVVGVAAALRLRRPKAL